MKTELNLPNRIDRFMGYINHISFSCASSTAATIHVFTQSNSFEGFWNGNQYYNPNLQEFIFCSIYVSSDNNSFLNGWVNEPSTHNLDYYQYDFCCFTNNSMMELYEELIHTQTKTKNKKKTQI
jgi:hypothetical protein